MVLDPAVGVSGYFLIGAVFDFVGKIRERYQREAEGTALAFLALYPNVAAVGSDNRLTEI